MAIKDIDGTLSLDERGNLKVFTGVGAIKESLRNLIFNFHDDYVLDPQLGSITYAFLHEQLSLDSAFMLRRNLRDVISRNETRLNIADVQIYVDIDEVRQAYQVSINFRYAGVQQELIQELEI